MDERFLIVRFLFSGKNARHDSWLNNISAIYEMLGAKMMRNHYKDPELIKNMPSLCVPKSTEPGIRERPTKAISQIATPRSYVRLRRLELRV